MGNQPCYQIDQEVYRAAVARMLDLTDILELIIDGFAQRALAQGQLLSFYFTSLRLTLSRAIAQQQVFSTTSL